MAGTFECPKCGTRVYLPEWTGGSPPICQHTPERQLNEKPERSMVVVD